MPQTKRHSEPDLQYQIPSNQQKLCVGCDAAHWIIGWSNIGNIKSVNFRPIVSPSFTPVSSMWNMRSRDPPSR